MSFGNMPPFYTPGYWPGGTVPNPSTFNAAVTMKETLTINKTPQAGVQEVLTVWKVNNGTDGADLGDAIGKLEVANLLSTNSVFVPYLKGTSASNNVATGIRGVITTDSGASPAVFINARTTADAALTTRPIVDISNGGNTVLSALPLNSGAGLALSWGTQSGGDPAFTTRSSGTRLVFYNQINGSNADYALGFNTSTGHIWSSVASATGSIGFKWFGGQTLIATLQGDGRRIWTGGEVDKLRVATTTPVTVATTDKFVVTKLASAGAVAVNLPASPTTGMVVEIQDGTGDAAANNVTITPAAGTINGAATKVISSNYGRVKLIYTGTEWLSN